MRVFVSADIEGVAGVCHWDETRKANADYEPFRAQMQAEVDAACRGALAAGAKRIRVRDAHGSGRNLRGDRLPDGVELTRAWSGHPLSMVQGVDEGFDALLMIGYHDAAGSGANPLAHTMTGSFAEVRVNGMRVAEMHLYGWAAGELGVPLCFVSGDEGICGRAEELGIRTVRTTRGIGSSVVSRHPTDVVRDIRAGVEDALDVLPEPIRPPSDVRLELVYDEPHRAYRAGFYPGAVQVSDRVVVFETDRWREALTAIGFMG